jgi:actin-related protein
MSGEPVVVVDVGSSSIKAGYAGEDTPPYEIPSVVDVNYAPTTKLIESTSTTAQFAKSTHPVSRGSVMDWKQMEKLWSVVMDTVISSTGNPGFKPSIFVVESCASTVEDRAQWAKILFENMHMPSICFGNSACLSLFASGRTTGLVMESGAGLTTSVPVFEGQMLSHAVSTMEQGGQDVTMYIHKQLADSGIKMDFATARLLKEQMAFTKSDKNQELDGSQAVRYELPDGQEIEIAHSTLHACMESLVSETKTTDGMSSMLSESIRLCDDSIMADLADNIILTGGNSMMRGLGDRLQSDLQHNFTQNALTNHLGVRVVPSSDYREAGFTTQRRYAAWIGGSIIGSLDSYKQLKITRQGWDEEGPSILQTRVIN